MSTFGTFLTNGSPYGRRRRGKVDLKQRFLRESNKYFPKPIRPKVNINPIVNYMVNQENRNQKHEHQYHQRTMEYKNCTQIVPTVGLSNLIFYDCNKKDSTFAEKSLEESISKIDEPSLQQRTEDHYEEAPSALETDGHYDNPYFEQEIITESIHHNVYLDTGSHQDWISHDFDESVRVPQTLEYRPVEDFTFASNARSSLLSSGIDSYNSLSLEIGFGHQTYYDNTSNHVMLHPDVNSFDLNLNDRNDQFGAHTELSNVDSFALDVTSQPNQDNNNLMDSESLNVAGFGIQLNSSDWRDVSQCEDVSMAKFAVSSCSDTSFEEVDGTDFYANFVPLHTSTPKARNKSNYRYDDVDREQMNGVNESSLTAPIFVPLRTSSPIWENEVRTQYDADDVTEESLHMTGEELFFNQPNQTNDSIKDFLLPGKKYVFLQHI